MDLLHRTASGEAATIHLRNAAPPMDLPRGYVGPAWLPGTGRMIWWTGRVAIGLRHEARARATSAPPSPGWLQPLLLGEHGAR